MNTTRRGYIVALVAAVVVLLGSMAAAVAYAANSYSWPWSPAGQSGDAWQQGPGPGGDMMDRGRGWDNGSGGMMGPDADGDDGPAQISLAQAKKLADDWIVENQPGGAAGSGTQMPVGYVFPVTKDDQIVGMLMVDDDTGQVIYRQWSGPTPSASGT